MFHGGGLHGNVVVEIMSVMIEAVAEKNIIGEVSRNLVQIHSIRVYDRQPIPSSSDTSE